MTTLKLNKAVKSDSVARDLQIQVGNGFQLQKWVEPYES
jgi:hypothetical protein